MTHIIMYFIFIFRFCNYIFLYIHSRTHGFDDQGRQFDLNGNLVDWWKESTKEHYLEKAKCIIEQYGNYTEPSTGLKVCSIIYIGV